MRKNQTVPFQGMKEIYEIACQGWKKTISEWTSPFSDTNLSSKQVEEMYEAADPKQKIILDKWLNKKDELEDKLENLQLPFKNPKTQVEKAVNSLIQMACIAEHYNEGTVLKWENTNQYKYQPYKYFSVGRWVFCYCYWSFSADFPLACCFKDSQSAIKAYETYPQIYDDFYGL